LHSKGPQVGMVLVQQCTCLLPLETKEEKSFLFIPCLVVTAGIPQFKTVIIKMCDFVHNVFNVEKEKGNCSM
jgi:hypothetical protein